MRFPEKHILPLFCLLCLAPVLAPLSAGADVKVMLKNGRNIVADSCRMEDGRLLCFRMGGSFEINAGEVAGVKETSESADIGDLAEPSVVEKPAAEGTPDSAAKEAGRGEAPPQGSYEKELSEIRQRKEQLLKERDQLVKDRQQLQNDVKNASDWMPVKRYEELQKRNSELEERIGKFNKEVTQLDAREKKVLDEMKPKPAGSGGQ